MDNGSSSFLRMTLDPSFSPMLSFAQTQEVISPIMIGFVSDYCSGATTSFNPAGRKLLLIPLVGDSPECSSSMGILEVVTLPIGTINCHYSSKCWYLWWIVDWQVNQYCSSSRGASISSGGASSLQTRKPTGVLDLPLLESQRMDQLALCSIIDPVEQLPLTQVEPCHFEQENSKACWIHHSFREYIHRRYGTLLLQ